MKKYTIYSDGSDFKHTSHRLGIGAVLIDENNKKLDSLSKSVSLDYMEFTYNTKDCSNPTMEMLAALESLKTFYEKIPEGSEVSIKADYIGVSKWPTGEWKINKPYIQKINSEIKEVLKKYNKNNITVKFEWVKGHQKVMDIDSYWNDAVDKLAKGELWK